MRIIYRVSDLKCVGIIPNNTTFEQQLQTNIILNFGGNESDYAFIETDKEAFHLELISGVVTPVNNPIIPFIDEESIKDNSIVIKKTVETTQPSEVTVSDQSDHWNIRVVRNITSQVVNEVTYYTYEYIEASAPKDTRTQQEIQAIALSRKNDFFTRAEYPIATIYDDTKSSSNLMKIIFAIMDKNDALTQRVATLEGGH